MCLQDARELRAEGARHGDDLVISMPNGQDVADEFRGRYAVWSGRNQKKLQEGLNKIATST